MLGNSGDPSGQGLQEWSVLWGGELRGVRTKEHSEGLAPRTGQGPLRDRFGVCLHSVWFVALGQWAFSHRHLEMEGRFVYQTGPPPVVIAVGLKVDAGL